MSPLEEIEQNIETIMAKTKEKIDATIAIFYDFDACKLKDFVSKEELDALTESALAIQNHLKESRAAIESYCNAREIYLACCGLTEKQLDEMPIVKKGDR